MSPARLTGLAGAALIAAGLAFRGTLPPPEVLSTAVREEPTQTPTRVAPFSVSSGGVEYSIAPEFDYDIAGLVVSRHDSETWWDTIHADSNDHLNVADLCLVWGVTRPTAPIATCVSTMRNLPATTHMRATPP